MAEETDNSVLTFHYTKSPSFKTVHADGAIGGVTPNGLIHFALYAERPAIPKAVRVRLEDNGALGDEIDREGLDGIVREMQVDAVLTPEAARSLAGFLLKSAESVSTARSGE